MIIRPDGIGEYAWGNRRVRLWLEWDMATMGRAQMREKFCHYAAYAWSKSYWEERPRSLPLLLIVVPTAAREAWIGEVVQELIQEGVLAPKGCLAIRTTTFALLAAHGPLALIWRPLLPRPDRAGHPPRATVLDGIRPLPAYAERPPTLRR